VWDHWRKRAVVRSLDVVIKPVGDLQKAWQHHDDDKNAPERMEQK
jgi:hypothetical protein